MKNLFNGGCYFMMFLFFYGVFELLCFLVDRVVDGYSNFIFNFW